MYGISADASFVADARTVAYSRISTGQHLRVSLGLAPPPASSFVYYDFPDTAPGVEGSDDDVDERENDDGEGEVTDEREEEEDDECEEEYDVDELRISVIAAHGDTVLLKMSHRHCPLRFRGRALPVQGGRLRLAVDVAAP